MDENKKLEDNNENILDLGINCILNQEIFIERYKELYIAKLADLEIIDISDNNEYKCNGFILIDLKFIPNKNSREQGIYLGIDRFYKNKKFLKYNSNKYYNIITKKTKQRIPDFLDSKNNLFIKEKYNSYINFI
jgi:hypothetical protein